jgi:predicted acyltransferase
MANPTPKDSPPSAPRILSVDAYRGFVMFLMMAEVLELRHVANALPDSSFWKFLAWHQTHVPWAGCTLHDLIQPSFSFLVGVALPFSLARREQAGSKVWMFLHAVWRAVLLALLGIFLRSMYSKQTNFTFDDTLTQIGFGYFFLFCLGWVKERWQWTALVVILVGYWAAFALYPLPGPEFDPTSVLPEKELATDLPRRYEGFDAHWNKNSNLAWAFDKWWMNLFPREKEFLFSNGGYCTLSFIPTLATMILGLIAGGWLRKEAGPWTKMQWFVLAGVALLALGIACHATGLCPVVKRIWTPSWVLYSGGWCFLLLAGFYAIIDAIGLAGWSYPLRVIGANSIVAYCLAHGPDGFIVRSFKIHFGQEVFKILGPEYEHLVTGIVVLTILWLILLWMYRKKIYVRI